MGVFNLIAALGALVIFAAGAGGAWAFDHHPPIGVHQRVLFWTVGFDLPDSLATQRDRAVAAAAHAVRDGAQCRRERLSLQAAITAQNAAVEALRQEGEARVAESRKAVLAARAVAQSERMRAEAILAARPASADDCMAAAQLIDEEASR